MLGGDFNLLMNVKMDTQSSTKHKAQKDALLTRKFTMDIGMVGVWRTLNPSQGIIHIIHQLQEIIQDFTFLCFPKI